jgi:ornithine cyclodeaminase/alanine dehydrogenase-like protein (mu-crystallin family)
MQIRVLSREDVHQVVTMAEAIEIVQDGFVQLSTRQAIVPARAAIDVKKHDGVMLYMPAYLSGSDALGMKLVSVFPRNVGRGRATINALVVINDAETGEPQALMDGAYLTALRTGAASGVATRWLARRDAEAVGVFGAGVQGRTQLEAVCAVRNIRRAWVYDVDNATAVRYVAEMRRRGGRIPADVRVAASPAEAVREADIICTATTPHTPVVPDEALKAGAHLNGIGSFTPEMREIGPATVRRARVVVDSREAAWTEAGDLIMAKRDGLFSERDVYAEIGEIAAGLKLGREDETQITFFKAVGIAVQDVSVARYALQKAIQLGLGATVEL